MKLISGVKAPEGVKGYGTDFVSEPAAYIRRGRWPQLAGGTRAEKPSRDTEAARRAAAVLVEPP
jgi:hypothetical protein